MRTVIILLCALPLFLPGNASADESGVALTVKPVLCITDRRTPFCDLGFLVAWRSDAAGYFCLYNDFSEGPLRCWSERREGSLEDERSVSESFSYWMTDADPDAKLAQVTVEVLRMDSGDRRRSRRTRHVWDIN